MQSSFDDSGENFSSWSEDRGIFTTPKKSLVNESNEFLFYLQGYQGDTKYDCSSSLSATKAHFLGMSDQELDAYATSHVFSTSNATLQMYHAHAHTCARTVTSTFSGVSQGTPVGNRADTVLRADIPQGVSLSKVETSNHQLEDAYWVSGSYNTTSKRLMLFLTEKYPAEGGSTAGELLINRMLQLD